jgi:hypothetical protein
MGIDIAGPVSPTLEVVPATNDECDGAKRASTSAILPLCVPQPRRRARPLAVWTSCSRMRVFSHSMIKIPGTKEGLPAIEEA